jgi:hypothetical protein
MDSRKKAKWMLICVWVFVITIITAAFAAPEQWTTLENQKPIMTQQGKCYLLDIKTEGWFNHNQKHTYKTVCEVTR